jgi:methyl-accepting chemotaxis protein
MQFLSIRTSLQKKLILLFILIATLPLLVASYFSFVKSKEALVSEVEKGNAQIAQAMSSELDLMIEARLKLLRVASRDNDIMSLDPGRMAANVKSYASQYGDMPGVIISNINGQQIYRNEGTLSTITDRQYFQEIKQGLAYSISDVLISKGTGKSSIVLSVPIKNVSGQVIGLVSGVMDLQSLSTSFSSKKFGQSGYAFIVDKTGKIIAHPNPEFVKEQKDVTAIIAVRNVIEGKTGVDYYTWENVEKIAGYSVVPNTRWGVIVQMSEAEALQGAQKIKFAAFAIGSIAIVLASIIGFFMSRMITRPINQMVDASEVIAAGNLTYVVKIDSEDELGKLANSFNTMVGNLRNLVKQVVSTSETLAASAQQLSASAEEATNAVEQIATTAGELAAGAQNQTREVTTAARTVEELSRSAHEVAAKAESAAALSQDMATSAQTGNTSVQNAVEKMVEIDAAVASTAGIVKELGMRSKEIGNIVEVITNIAGQTNLLALNAAIEAARAGEQGRGFAVVADEVRKLAEQAQEAAGQIAGIINQIQGQTEKAVDAMEGGTRKVTEGVRVAKEAGVSIDGILTKVQESVIMIQSISAAAEEQAAATGEVVQSIDTISAVAQQSSAGAQTAAAATEETTASMEEISSSSQALAQAASQLQNMVMKFRV